MLISLHLPKTAGTSFRSTLESTYGSTLLKDYGDTPLHLAKSKRNKKAFKDGLANGRRKFSGTECIHGHFLPLKYLLLSGRQDITFVTWMREPVERLLSHYYYWKATYDPKNSHSLHKKMMQEGWTLERFCLGEEFRNTYDQFLYGFPLEYFSFIGVTEHHDEDFEFFTKEIIGIESAPVTLNQTKREPGQYEIPNSFREKVANHHAKDISLYNRALEKGGIGKALPKAHRISYS